MSAERKSWAVVDGHYPCMKELSGPSFRVNVVMWATDLTEYDYQKREADLHLMSAAPDLFAVAQKIKAHGTISSTWIDELDAAIAKAKP